MSTPHSIPSVSVSYAQDGSSTRSNSLGMRPMQERAYQKRGEPYLLIKSPPASGKSRALMFIALDKLANQKIKQAIIVVPERSIGASFHDEPLSQYGFFADWKVEPKWNLCDAPGTDNGGKVESVKKFLESEDKAHLVAMTGSYFRGDAVAVLDPEDEAKFETVTYTYYEQLNGYQYLKQLDIGYYFYAGQYTDEILNVLNPNEKTILHIPNVNSRESLGDKIREVEHIIHELGEWQGVDPVSGFQLVKTKEGRILKIADLVDDDASKRDRVSAALKDPAQKNNRDHVDIIIALGMAKEGFDWIWCEHALTVGYRSSLTEIIQIIGRATRDAPGKPRARFTNLIAEPDASEQAVAEAVNDTLKAIAASLLMEQVLAPRFEFKPKNPNNTPTPGFDYGPNGYDPNGTNVGVNTTTGQIQLEIKGLVEPKSPEAGRICREDLNELITAFVQDKRTVERGLFDPELVPEELTQVRMGKIVKETYPHLDDEDQEAVRQHAVAALNLVQEAKKTLTDGGNGSGGGGIPSGGAAEKNTSLIDGVRRYALSVTELDIDLIDRINPFGEAYAILAKSMGEERLKQVAEIIAARRLNITLEEARDLAKRALVFKKEKGRLPSITAVDPWEKRMAEGIAFLQRKAREEQNG